MENPQKEKLIAALRETAQSIRDIEEEAFRALNESGDNTVYIDKMREKAHLLSELSGRMAPLTADLPGELREPVEDRLARFSASAAAALNLDSIFYMYALLYPEDYSPGDPNDLERFIAALEEETG